MSQKNLYLRNPLNGVVHCYSEALLEKGYTPIELDDKELAAANQRGGRKGPKTAAQALALQAQMQGAEAEESEPVVNPTPAENIDQAVLKNNIAALPNKGAVVDWVREEIGQELDDSMTRDELNEIAFTLAADAGVA